MGVVGNRRFHLRSGYINEEMVPVTIPCSPLRIIHPGVATHETDDGALGAGSFHPEMITGVTEPTVDVAHV